ncbi:MAG: crossover junction endodeoxyribonuclease RuvC [Clostridia bacterium]|nr:crossover junction endodeoxyribonuclease RuvC [Clostridia bacterium]
MIILGIDPGYGLVGFGVIEKNGGNINVLDFGCISTSKDDKLSRRLEIISDCMHQLLDKWKPDEMAIEKLFFNKNVTTGIPVAQARGVILLSAQERNIPIYQYTPQNIKMALTGMGKADKKQMQFMVKTVLGLREVPKPDDAADALAVAICHSQTNLNMVGNI